MFLVINILILKQLRTRLLTLQCSPFFWHLFLSCIYFCRSSGPPNKSQIVFIHDVLQIKKSNVTKIYFITISLVMYDRQASWSLSCVCVISARTWWGFAPHSFKTFDCSSCLVLPFPPHVSFLCTGAVQCEWSGLEPDALPYIHPRVYLTSMESLSNEVATQIKSVSYYTTSSGEWFHTELNCGLWDFTPALYRLSYKTKFGCWLTLCRCLNNQLPNTLLGISINPLAKLLCY